MVVNTSLVALRGDLDRTLAPHAAGHASLPAKVSAAGARPAAESGVESRAALHAMLAMRADEAAQVAAGVRAQGGLEGDQAVIKLYPPYPREYEARRARLAALEKLDAELMFRGEASPPENTESAQALGASIAARLAAEPRASLSRQGARGLPFIQEGTA